MIENLIRRAARKAERLNYTWQEVSPWHVRDRALEDTEAARKALGDLIGEILVNAGRTIEAGEHVGEVEPEGKWFFYATIKEAMVRGRIEVGSFTRLLHADVNGLVNVRGSHVSIHGCGITGCTDPDHDHDDDEGPSAAVFFPNAGTVDD